MCVLKSVLVLWGVCLSGYAAAESAVQLGTVEVCGSSRSTPAQDLALARKIKSRLESMSSVQWIVSDPQLSPCAKGGRVCGPAKMQVSYGDFGEPKAEHLAQLYSHVSSLARCGKIVVPL